MLDRKGEMFTVHAGGERLRCLGKSLSFIVQL